MKIELVESVLREGRCTPNCMLALDEESKKCGCRCHGAYHGTLADHQVIANRTAWNWYEPDDVVCLNSDEYCEVGKGEKTWDDFNRAYRNSHGRFLAVVKWPDSYEVRASYDEGYWGTRQEYPKLVYFMRLLMVAGIVRECWMPGKCGKEKPRVSGFDVSVTGVRSKNDATVIHNQILNYIYGMDYFNRLDSLNRNLEELLRIQGVSVKGLKDPADAISLEES